MATSTIALAPSLWFDRYFQSLSSVARSQIRDRDAADDLVQETFAAALAARNAFRGDASEKSWLTSILRNKIVDFLRRRTRRKTSPASAITAENQSFEQQIDAALALPGFAPRVEAPEAPALLAELEAQVRESLDELSPRVARAFVLREIDGRSTEDVCSELGITKANLWVMVHRARRHLQKALESSAREEEGGAASRESQDGGSGSRDIVHKLPRAPRMQCCG